MQCLPPFNEIQMVMTCEEKFKPLFVNPSFYTTSFVTVLVLSFLYPLISVYLQIRSTSHDYILHSLEVHLPSHWVLRKGESDPKARTSMRHFPLLTELEE